MQMTYINSSLFTQGKRGKEKGRREFKIVWERGAFHPAVRNLCSGVIVQLGRCDHWSFMQSQALHGAYSMSRLLCNKGSCCCCCCFFCKGGVCRWEVLSQGLLALTFKDFKFHSTGWRILRSQRANSSLCWALKSSPTHHSSSGYPEARQPLLSFFSEGKKKKISFCCPSRQWVWVQNVPTDHSCHSPSPTHPQLNEQNSSWPCLPLWYMAIETLKRQEQWKGWNWNVCFYLLWQASSRWSTPLQARLGIFSTVAPWNLSWFLLPSLWSLWKLKGLWDFSSSKFSKPEFKNPNTTWSHRITIVYLVCLLKGFKFF